MSTSAQSTTDPTAPTYCARHPDVETGLSCGRCGTPICPRCLVYTPAGTRCPTCAAIGRPKMYVMAPLDYARGIAAAIVIGAALGVLGAMLVPPRPSFGLFTILLGGVGGYGAGTLVAAALDVAMGRKRGREVQIIAAGAVIVAAIGRLVLSGAPLEFALRDFTGLVLIAVALSVSSTRLR